MRSTGFIIAIVMAILAAGGVVIASVLGNPWFGIAFFAGTFGAFILQGLRRVPTVHRGVLTVFGKRVAGNEGKRDEGWHFFPFFPFFHGVNVEKRKKLEKDV